MGRSWRSVHSGRERRRERCSREIENDDVELVVLSGGVGGARLARGFEAIPGVDATVVVNVGDDDVVHGLHVAADIDTVTYTLSERQGPHGWGRAEETWNVMAELATFPDADIAFRLGDRDMALNMYRTGLMTRGVALSDVTHRITKAFGIGSTILPVSDDRIRTEIEIETGWIDFQTYFVRRGHRDHVRSVRYSGIEGARPAPGVLDAINRASAVVIAPSNPVLSIWPILAVDGIREAVADRPVIAVSPLVNGKAVNGPAVESLAAFDLPPTVAGIIEAYDGLIDAIAVASEDATAAAVDTPLIATDILIPDIESSIRLANRLLTWVR